jgi:hypothetical protein
MPANQLQPSMRPRDAAWMFIIACRVAVIALALLSIAFTYLTIDAVRSGCAGQEWIGGYHIELARMRSAWISTSITVIGALIFSAGPTRHYLATRNKTLFQIASIRVTFGILIVYGFFISFIGGSTYGVWYLSTRYRVVAQHCYQSTDLNTRGPRNVVGSNGVMADTNLNFVWRNN